MDFGLARDTGSSVAQGLTESGAVIGTPAYMSPEQARGEARRLDRRSDVYSLGATLYDMLSGKPPFQDETVVNLLIKVMNDSPVPLRSQLPDVPEALDLIVSKCLNKEAEQRYQTALALAQDLDRFLTAGRVEARRLGYLYRLRYWSKRNRALAALALALIVGGLGSIAVGIRNHLQNLRREAEAKAEAALAQTLGQSVKDLEWLVRTAYLLPLHDTSYEKGLVRGRMAAIHRELQNAGEKGVRLGAYVLGRGHLALHEWDAAYEQLSRAEKLGYRDAGLDYALGRVLGEKYSRALDEARKSGDKSFVEKRKKELETEFLFPARSYLSRSRSQTTETPSYVEALIDFYNEHYDAALLNAHMARKQAPWLYEAAKLEGDVHMVRALAQRDRGDSATAEKSFALAVARYEDAAAVGHSDHQVHEALAEAWIRQEEMDLYRGIDPTPKMQKALTAADHAIEAAPKESYGHTKKAFAYDFVAQFSKMSGLIDKARAVAHHMFKESTFAIIANKSDPYAFENLGNALRAKAEIEAQYHIDPTPTLSAAYNAFEKALAIIPNSPWFLNDYAGALKIEVDYRILHQKSPDSLLARIYALCQAAIRQDPEFINAYVTFHTSLSVDLFWKIEHGTNPRQVIERIQVISREVNKISPGYIPFQWNEIFVHQYILRHAIDTNNRTEIINSGLEKSLDQMLSKSNDSLEFQVILFRSFMLLADAKRSIDIVPLREVQLGIKAASECLKTDPKQADCLFAKSQLEALELSLQLASELKPRLSPVKALRDLTLAAASPGIDHHSLLWCAETILSMVRAQSQRLSQGTAALISTGVQCANRAMGDSPGWPRAKALRGALKLWQASVLQDKELRRAALAGGNADLASAISMNQFLKRRYDSPQQKPAMLDN